MSHKRNTLWIVVTFSLLLAATGVAALASQVTVPNTFTAGTTASAGEVNANFVAVQGAINNNDSRLSNVEDYRIGGFIVAGACVNLSGVLQRSFDHLGTAITAVTSTRISAGVYEVDFDRAVAGAFYQATLGTPGSSGNVFAGSIGVQPKPGNVNVLRVVVSDSSGTFLDHGFYLLVH